MMYMLITTGPVYILCIFLKENVQTVLAYTGGYTGLLILFIWPALLLFKANIHNISRKLREINIHKSYFSNFPWQVMLWCGSVVSFVAVTIGFLEGHS